MKSMQQGNNIILTNELPIDLSKFNEIILNSFLYFSHCEAII